MPGVSNPDLTFQVWVTNIGEIHRKEETDMAFSVELPTPNDSPDEQQRKLQAFADAFGAEEYFNFKRYISDNKNTVVNRFQETLAAQMLRGVMKADPTLDFEEARRRLAVRLGYKELTRTNFYKLIDAGLVLINRDDLKKYKPKKKLAAV